MLKGSKKDEKCLKKTCVIDKKGEDSGLSAADRST
jgi:hypothetical protein